MLVLTARQSAHARKEIIVAAIAISLGHILDLLSTYWANPDLSREVGHLHLKFKSLGIGTWANLVTTKLLFAALSALSYVLIMRARRRFYPGYRDGTFSQFLHVAHSRGAARRRDGSWYLPSPRLILLWTVYIVTVGGAVYAWALAAHNFAGSPPWMATAGGCLAGIVSVFGFWVTAWWEYRAGAPMVAGSDAAQEVET